MNATVILACFGSGIPRDNTVFVFPDDAVFPEDIKHLVGSEPTHTVSGDPLVAWLFEEEQEKYRLVERRTDLDALTVKKLFCITVVE